MREPENTRQPVSASPAASQTSAPAAEKSSRKKTTLLLIVAALLAAAVLAGSFVFVQSRQKTARDGQFPIYWNFENKAMEKKIILEDGSILEPDSTICQTAVTADRRHIILQDTDYALYAADGELSPKTRIDQCISFFYLFNNSGMLYITQDEKLKIVSFADAENPVELGSYPDISSVALAQNALTAAYVENGNVMLWKEDSRKAEKLGEAGEFSQIRLVSDDGSSIVFEDTGASDSVLKLFENGGETVLMPLEEGITSAVFSADEKAVLASTGVRGKMCLKKMGEEPVTFRTGSEILLYDTNPCVYADGVPFGRVRADDIRGLQILSDDGVFYADRNGACEQLAGGARHYHLYGDRLFFMDDADTLLTCSLRKNRLGETETAATDVRYYDISANGSYIYYTASDGTFYVREVGKEKPVRLEKGIYLLYANTGDPTISADGKTAYFVNSDRDLLFWDGSSLQPVRSNISYTVIDFTEGDGCVDTGCLHILLNRDDPFYYDYGICSGKEIRIVAENGALA